MSFENDSNDFDLEIVSGDVICKDRKIIGNPDTLFTLEITLKDYYEIKDFKEENVQKDPLASKKLVKISENLKLLGSENKEIDLLKSEYKLEDITLEDLPIEKQKIKRKYRITLKLIDNIKLKANLEKITFKVELKPYEYNNNQNTKDLLTNTDKYFNTSFAIKDFANIPAGTKITFTFKDVKDSQIRKLLLNGSTVDIKDNKYTLEVNDNAIIEYGILETYKVSIKEKTQEKYFNFVDNIKEPILEGTDVTFSLKEITNDKISKILINGNDGKVEYNEKTKQYHFKINENSEIEIVLK